MSDISADAAAMVDDATIRRKTLAAIRGQLIDTLIPDLTPGSIATSGHIVLRLVDHLIALDAEGVAAGTSVLSECAVSALIVQPDADSRAAIRRFAEQEWETLIARDPEARGGVIQMYLGGKTSRVDEKTQTVDDRPKLTADTLQSYLRVRFPDDRDVAVLGMKLLPGGMSKQTYLVQTRKNGRDENFVIRKDMERAPNPLSAVQEFDMLSAMWPTGAMPMAQPLWAEADRAVFGTPLMAVSLVDGSTDYSAALGDAAVADQFADALAKAMARLHAMPLQDTTAGPLVERSQRAHVLAEIERWHAILRTGKIGPEPALEGVFAWLRDNIPEQRAPSAVIHGDIGFHNMLMHDGRLTALLDWEFAHIGDPAEDVVYARFFVEQVVPWARFLDMYEAHGGVRPSAEQERFYATWQSARNAAGCAGAGRVFIDNEGADPKLAVSGMTFKPRFTIDALQRIVAE